MGWIYSASGRGQCVVKEQTTDPGQNVDFCVTLLHEKLIFVYQIIMCNDFQILRRFRHMSSSNPVATTILLKSSGESSHHQQELSSLDKFLPCECIPSKQLHGNHLSFLQDSPPPAS